MSSCFLVCFCCFSFAFVFSLTLWYFSIDLELTSVRPKGQIPLRWILHYLFTHRQIAQWMDVPGLGGHNQIFSMQIRTLSFLKLSVASLLFLIRASQVPFCYWNVHKIFVYLTSVLQIIAKIMMCTVKIQKLWNIFACVLENFSGPNIDYTSKMAECSFHVVLQFHTLTILLNIVV